MRNYSQEEKKHQNNQRVKLQINYLSKCKFKFNWKQILFVKAYSKSCFSVKKFNDFENSSTIRKMKLQGYMTNKSTEEPNLL